MAQFVSNPIQTVEAGQNVLLTDTVVCGNCLILHRKDSGIITLKADCKCPFTRFLVDYSANIAVETDETVGAISVALALSGEPLLSTEAIVTPAAVDNYFNVSSQAYIDVPKGCCYTIALENTSDIAINVQNANVTVVRTA